MLIVPSLSLLRNKKSIQYVIQKQNEGNNTLPAKLVTIDESHAGQRVDNFLITQLKGVPHSRIYKALRKGEVRVNKGRVQATYRVQIGDSVRLPPLRVSEIQTIRPSEESQRPSNKICATVTASKSC